MSNTKRRYKQNTSDTSQTINNNDSFDLVSDHNFIAPFEICDKAIGLLSILMNRHIIDMSFSKLYQQSLKLSWEKIFVQERQKLKPNDISVLKCFVLNRLLYEYSKDSNAFKQQATNLYDQIKSRMSREFPRWTSQDLFNEVRRWQDMQCRRRLFYFNYQELVPLPGLLMLQKAATNWCYCLINHCQQNKNFWENEGRHRLTEFFQHSFIIVAQPTGSDGSAVTQYIKGVSGHSARLDSRIICLLDLDILKDHIELSDIDVTLYPLNRETNDKKEKQPSIKWKIRKIMSAENTSVSIYSAEIHTLQLETFDAVCKRLSLNSTLCQLEFRFMIKVKNPQYEQMITLTTQPFGICSHGQYFPKYIAQIFLYEMKQILNNNIQITDPDIMTEFVRRYHTRMIGVEPTDHTNRYIRDVFVKALEDVKSTRTTTTLDSIYEEILAKIISQIDFMVLHPVLSLMYNDSLFLGICNSTEVDRMLHGSREEPQMLLRFNNLMNHQWNGSVTVQFIIHDGNLKKASFDMKTFANEMCRFICESLSDRTKQGLVLSTMSPRYFTNYQWYFHEELYRLNKMTPLGTDSYDPLLPILWMTMRKNYDPDTVYTPVISNNITYKRKRNDSDSLPLIESVSSEPQSTSMNIIIHLDNIQNGLVQSTNIHCSTTSKSKHNSALMVVEKVSASNDEECTTKNQEILIEIPKSVGLSPAIVFRHLAEKFAHTADDQNESLPLNYLIRPKQITMSLSNTIDANNSVHIKSPGQRPASNSSASSETSRIESSILTGTIQQNVPDQLNIKEEPNDVDYAVIDRINC